jgi:two-component system cell cycle response regulator DivK
VVICDDEADRHGKKIRAVTSALPDPPLVLIVYGNEKNLKLHRDVLRADGLRTLEAATAGQGIDLATMHKPHVTLMDLGLPDMDGVDAARALAQDPRTAEIPVVALTSLRLEDEGDRLRAAGFAGYLEKPISVAAVPAQVRGYC